MVAMAALSAMVKMAAMAKLTLTKQLNISEYIANFLNIRLCL